MCGEQADSIAQVNPADVKRWWERKPNAWEKILSENNTDAVTAELVCSANATPSTYAAFVLNVYLCIY